MMLQYSSSSPALRGYASPIVFRLSVMLCVVPRSGLEYQLQLSVKDLLCHDTICPAPIARRFWGKSVPTCLAAASNVELAFRVSLYTSLLPK